MESTANDVKPTAAQRIINSLRDCSLADWQWLEAGRTLMLRFSWISFLGGEGHDVVLYLHGVSQFVFECPDDKERNEYYSVFDASLTREIVKDNGKVRYRLQLEGEVTLEAVCQTCEIFEQVALGEADTQAVDAEEVTLADMKKLFAELDVLTAKAEAERPTREREWAEHKAYMKAAQQRWDKTMEEMQIHQEAKQEPGR